MTYDYSAGDAGPNGPIDWQQENVEKLISRTKDGGGSLSGDVLHGILASIRYSGTFA